MLGPEATLIVLCLTGAVPSELSHWLQRMQNPPVARSPYLLRMGLWRAFHSRWPVLMRCARTQMVRDLEFPSDTLLVAILRDGHVRVPRGSSVLEASDELVVLATPQAHAKLTGQPLPEEIGSAAPIAARPALLESARALWGRVARVLRREKT